MGIWIGIALVLLAALGVVTGLQRRTEFSHRIEAARGKQRKIAEALMKSQRETEFADSYQTGEARELAQAARSQAAHLSSQFSEATRRLESFRGWSTLFPTMDGYVGIARVLEEYEAVEKGLQTLTSQLQRLDSVMKSAKEQTGTLAEEWSQVKQQITQAVGNELPSSWTREFQQIEADLLQVSVVTDLVQRAAKLQQMTTKVQGWKQDLGKLAIWGEWRAQAENRRPLMEATVARLTQVGADQAQACVELKAALTNLNHLLSLTAKEVREPENSHFFELLGPPFTGLLNRASVLLSLLADKARLLEAVDRQRTRLQSLSNRFRDLDYSSHEQTVNDAQPTWFSGYQQRRAQLSEMITTALLDAGSSDDLTLQTSLDAKDKSSSDGQNPGTPRNTPVKVLLLVDKLLFLGEQATNLQSELESRFAHEKQLDAAYDARLKVLADRISDGLAKLAGANLMQSDEYGKLNRWQEEVHRLQSEEVPSQNEVERLEQRVKDEWKVVEAAVNSRTSIDRGLQEHLDELVHRHQKTPGFSRNDSGSHRTFEHRGVIYPGEFGSGRGFGGRGMNSGAFGAAEAGTFSAESMAWTSLILTEEALASSTWAMGDDWF